MCRLFRITGRVQGVFFRASTRNAAAPLGVAGHAINLADGSVEVRACGTDDAVDSLYHWLQHGPPAASVKSVEEQATTCTHPDRFTTG
jgi:acylphosphatase